MVGHDSVRPLRFIRHARQLGFEIKDIKALLGLTDWPDSPCDDADLIARTHLEVVEEKISQLIGLRDELARMVACCGTGTVGDCRVIEVLSDHERH